MGPKTRTMPPLLLKYGHVVTLKQLAWVFRRSLVRIPCFMRHGHGREELLLALVVRGIGFIDLSESLGYRLSRSKVFGRGGRGSEISTCSKALVRIPSSRAG